MHMTTGQLIKAARKEAGITQAELAKKLDIPYQSVSQWERDTRKPKMDTLMKIADALGCDFSFLLPDEFVDVYFMGATRSYDEIRRNRVDEDNVEELSEGLLKIFDAYEKLNGEGQQKAVERVEELAEIPRYRRAETAPQNSPTPQEGTDTTPVADCPKGPPKCEEDEPEDPAIEAEVAAYRQELILEKEAAARSQALTASDTSGEKLA